MFRNTQRTVGQNRRAVVSSQLSVACPARQRTTDHGPRTFSASPQPPAPNPVRPGISLTEVLIAMGILTIGLLGVASVFPVGSYYMQKGEVADRASAIGQAAFNDALARGMLNPENWIGFEDGATFPNVVPTGIGSRFTRPIARRMRDYRAALLNRTPPYSPVELQKRFLLESGSIFVIDPIGIASIAEIDATTGLPQQEPGMIVGGVFPSTSVRPTGGIRTNVGVGQPWYNWSDQWNLGPRWPIRRVAFAQPNATAATLPLDAAMARKLFSSHDDLTLDLPDSQDRPSVQPWRLARLDGGTAADDALHRLSRGNYSWIITVAPSYSNAQENLLLSDVPAACEVSVVVFYKRPLATVTPTSADERLANTELMSKNERTVSARIVSSGLNGGEVLLAQSSVDILPESPFGELKTGNWVMLCGPHPNSTDERPLIVARWYRVLSIEGKNERLNELGNPDPSTPSGDPERRLVALRGPQWPWQPAYNTSSTYDSDLSNQLYVCIPTGAVAVHAKKIRLEGNSIYNGGVTGLTSR